MKLVPLEKWCKSLARSQAKLKSIKIVYFCAFQCDGSPASHSLVIWAPDPQLRRRRNNSVSLTGNVSYCKEILGVSLLTMLSTSALVYLLLSPVKGSSAFRSIQCEYTQSWLLYSSSSWCSLLSPFPLFSIWCFSSITYPAPFFLSNLSAPSETNQNFQIGIRYSSFPDTWKKTSPQTNIFKKINRKTCRKSLIKMSLGYNCLQTNHFTKFSQWIMSFSITTLWSLPQ